MLSLKKKKNDERDELLIFDIINPTRLTFMNLLSN